MNRETGNCAAANPIMTWSCKLYPRAKIIRTESSNSGGKDARASVVRNRAVIWSGDRIRARGDLTWLSNTPVAVARPMVPPMVRNWTMALMATALKRKSLLDRSGVQFGGGVWGDLHGHLSRFSTAKGVIKIRVLRFIPTPNPAIA